MRWNIFGPTNAEAGPSTYKADQDGQTRAVPTVNRYEGMLKDEEAYQAAQYQTTEEVPGCMTLLYASRIALSPGQADSLVMIS